MHPYRDMPPTQPACERERPLEEPVLVFALVILGGARVALAIHDGVPWSGEATIALIVLIGAAQAWLRLIRRRARRWWRRSGTLQDRERARRDRAGAR